MSGVAEAFVAAYRPFVIGRLAARGIDVPTEALVDGESWLAAELEALLAQPFEEQRRGPLELFQAAMRQPTDALRALGVVPVSRNTVAEAALPGDVYDLAPASSQDLGEAAWHAHLEWGAAKARAITGQS